MAARTRLAAPPEHSNDVHSADEVSAQWGFPEQEW